MFVVKVPARIGSGFGEGLNSLFQLLLETRSIGNNEPLLFDLRECEFLNPFLILPLMIIIQEESKKRLLKIETGKDRFFKAYLDLINFGNGLQPEAIEDGTYSDHFLRYANKSYIPIINFSTAETGLASDMREQCLSAVKTLMVKQLKLTGQLSNGLMYLIGEAIANAVEHSKSERGYIFAQYYPSRQYLDLCLCDTGKGILQSYRDYSFAGVDSHRQAIIAAATGKSTKNRPGAEDRGFGISSSKRMLSEGLRGSYFLYSGNAFVLKNAGNESVIEVPETYMWQGTILALRIPLNSNPKFNAHEYYEG